MVNNDQQQEKPQDFELMELLFQKVPSTGSNAADQLDKSFEARFQSLVDQIQSYLHSSEKPGFFPHRFLGSFSSVLDTKLSDKLGIKKLHFRFEGARTLKVVAETESKTHVFIFTEDIEAQHSKQTNTKNFEFTTGEWKNVMGRDYTKSDARKLQIDVIKILKDKYELVKSRPKSDKDVKSKKLHLYLKNNVLEYKAKDLYGNTQTMQINSDELKGNNAFKNKFFDEIKQFLGKSGKDLSDDVRKELSRLTSIKGYTLKADGEGTKINIKVESKNKIKDIPIPPPTEFPFKEVKKKLGQSTHLESYIEKLANPDAEIDQVQENLKAILNYIKKVYTNLDLQDSVYGNRAREADQHGFVAGVFDNFRYRDNTKLYLEQFAGGGYADIVLLVRGPNRAVDSVPILIELKAGTEGQVDPSDALRQAEDYIKGFRPNKMRILTNADNAIAVGLNLDNAESFKIEVKPIKQPPAPLMEEFIELAGNWDNQPAYEEVFKREVKDLLSSEYHTFPANKETKDHYYFSRDILGQSILINKIGQDQGNVKKYIYSYNEYPLNWPQGTEYTLSKSPVTTLIFVQGNEGQEKTAFIFHIRESNTREFYTDKKIPVLDIPGIGRVGNVIEIKMSLKKYETGLSFEELFEIEQISKYKPSSANQQFAGNFLKIPNADELKAKLDQAITSQHASDGEVSLQAYKVLLTEVADKIYSIKDLITNEARLQAILNGLFSSYSDLKLQETSAKTVVIPEFQVGAGGRVDMVIQGIGPSPQGTKEYTPIALEFKLIDKNLNQDQLKQEVDKLIKEQNVRYARGAALKAITDSDKMFFMGVVVNVRSEDINHLILTSDKFVPALVVHSSIDIVKRKHLEEIQEVTQRLKNIVIQQQYLDTLEYATEKKDYRYWLQQHDIADIARIEYGYGADTLFEVVGSPEHIANQLQQFQNSVATRGEKRPLTLIVNLDNNHWVTLVISHQNGQYNGYYVDSLGNDIPGNIRQVLERARITVNDVSIAQQTDGHNCGLWALENAHSLNQMIANGYDSDWVRDLLLFNRNEAYFQEQRENISDRLSIDPQRIANLDEAILAETQANRKKFNLNSCVRSGGRSKRSVNPCLFSKSDVEKFSKGKVDENNVDKTIIDSEKFLTYVKNSQDEAKNAQLVEFVGDKSIEGDRKYLLDKVVGDQGYERYVQNERVKNLHGDISQQASSATKGSKLKGRLMNAAGGIQLIRGIHGAIVSCKEGTATDCGLNLGGIGWSFASQPIENVMVKITPKVVASAEKVVGKIIPGTLGKQTKFAIRVVGVKFGSTIARGTAGAVTGVFDIVDIGMSANNLVDCKKRENSDNPCGEKEIRDNIATISFSTISFVSGVALTALGMPGIGIAVGVALMVASGVYSGVSNIVEYEKKYDTTHDENWRIFWHTFAFQPVPQDVQHLAARKEMVNSLAKGVWKALNNDPSNVVAYSIGLGKINGNTLRPDYATIMMNRKNANTQDLSRVIPDYIEGASMICLPHSTSQDYEKGIKSLVPSAKYYCDNAMVISHDKRVNMMQKDKTIIYDLSNVDRGTIVGSNEWNNNFLIGSGTANITGGSNKVVNRFVVNNVDFSGKTIGGSNSVNILDLSQLKDTVIGVNVNYRFKPSASGSLKARVNGRWLINDQIDNNGIFNYYYVGRKNKVDEISCMGYSEHFTAIDDRDVIIDSSGGSNKNEKDFSIQQCDLYLKYNNSNIRVKNYFQDPNYRHLIIMNKKGETFIPNIQSMSCSPSSSGKGKLVPFLQATQTQNMFLLPKDFQGDHVVIDSRLEDIEKYKDKDDLLLIRERRENEIPFIIRIEGFYTNRNKWKNISYSLWNNNDLFLSSGLLENVDNVMEYKDKLRDNYKRIVKEYIMDFSNPTTVIQHNQRSEKSISTFIGKDEERIGVMILKNITPGQVEIFSNGADLIFRDKMSNHTINIKDWDNNEFHRISTLEFDLGLEPITLRRLDRFSLSEVRKIQALINKASENYQNRSKYTPKVENDFKCLISVDDFERENRDPAHQCLGFPSLQDRVSFTESSCNLEQIEELKNKTPSSNQILTLLEKLENNLLLNGYDSNIIDQCNNWMISSGLGVLKPLVSTAVYEGKEDEVKVLLDKAAKKSIADVEHKNQCSQNWTALNYAVYNGNVKLSESVFKSFLDKKGDINALTSCNDDNWALLHYAVHYSNFDMVSFLIDKGANIEIRSKEGQTPLHLAVEEAKQNIINLLLDRGADIEAKNNDGRTPLYLAAYNNDSGVIELLCNRIKTKSNDAFKMIKQVGFLKKEVVNQANIPSNAKRLVESCISSLRDSIKSAAKKVLKEGILHSRSASTIELIDKVYNFDERLFNEAIKEAVNDTYAGVGIEGILRFIRSHHYIGQFIPGYIAAFDKIPKNDGAMFKLAYSIRETMKMPSVNSEEKSDLEKLKNKLPESVRNAVFSSEVCIKNVEYGRYLYSPNSASTFQVDNNRRYVFTWPSNEEGGQFKWKIENCGSTRKRRSIRELNGYNQTVVDYQLILTEENSQQIASRISAIVEDIERHTFLNQSKNKLDLDSYLNNRGRSNAADSMRRDVCSELNANGRRNIVLSGNDVCSITSDYETLGIENFPIQEIVVNDDANGKKSLRSTLDLHQ